MYQEDKIMNDCLFCKIAGGEIPSKKVYELSLIHISEPTRH